MKVLHINSNYLYTTLFDKMTENLIYRDIDNTVFMPNNGMVEFVIPSKPYIYSPICFNKRDRYLYNYKQKKIFRCLTNRLDVTSYDVIHAHTLFTDGHISYKLKQNFGIPYVVAVRNTDVNMFFKYMIHLRKTGINILKEAEKVIFLSETYKDIVMDKYIPTSIKKEIIYKSEIIPNGIDKFWLENKEYKKEKQNKKKLKIIYAGVINKNKNILTTIKAIEILQKRNMNIEFTVVGKIYDKSIYNQIIKKDYVFYVEQKSKEELLKIYRDNDLFVMPSITETFGLVYAEAMSQGLPVIYTKGQGFDGQFEEGQVGYSVISNNPENIANAIESAISNYMEISNRCTQLSSKFDWNLIANQYEDIYDKSIKVYDLNI